MKRTLQVGFGVLTLVVLSSLGAFAAPVEEPLVSAELAVVASPPAGNLTPGDVSWLEAAVNDDVNDTVVRICCRGALAVCTASCGGSVSSFTCTAVGAGCTSSCACGAVETMQW